MDRETERTYGSMTFYKNLKFNSEAMLTWARIEVSFCRSRRFLRVFCFRERVGLYLIEGRRKTLGTSVQIITAEPGNPTDLIFRGCVSPHSIVRITHRG